MQFPAHKVIITGTGRAGTTFIVRLLTEIGCDTGFDCRSWKKSYSEHCCAGLEWDILSPAAPYIVKNPRLCETLPSVLATGNFIIDHAIVPIRNLEAAALSRVRVGGQGGNVPGGLWKTNDPSAQKAVLGEEFHRLMLTLAEHDIPVTLMAFPQLVEDADYAFRKLSFLFPKVSRAQFSRAFARIARPELVHRFAPGALMPAPMPPPEVFAREVEAHRRHLLRRKLRRTAARYGMAAALLLVPGGAWIARVVNHLMLRRPAVFAVTAPSEASAKR